MPHDRMDYRHSHGHGHNHADGRHLHSHTADPDHGAELQLLTAQFIDGFAAAADKASFLRLAGVPAELPGRDGGPAMKLVDVKLTTQWQVGTASPSFGSRELSYLPFPGAMVTERTNMHLVYVSLEARHDLDIRDFLLPRVAHDRDVTNDP